MYVLLEYCARLMFCIVVLSVGGFDFYIIHCFNFVLCFRPHVQDPIADGETNIKSSYAELNEQIQESFRKLED